MVSGFRGFMLHCELTKEVGNIYSGEGWERLVGKSPQLMSLRFEGWCPLS